MLSGANLPHVVCEAPPAAPPVMPKVVADKGIGPEIKAKKEVEEEKYKDVLDEKDKSDQASALSPQMARVI